MMVRLKTCKNYLNKYGRMPSNNELDRLIATYAGRGLLPKEPQLAENIVIKAVANWMRVALDKDWKDRKQVPIDREQPLLHFIKFFNPPNSIHYFSTDSKGHRTS